MSIALNDGSGKQQADQFGQRTRRGRRKKKKKKRHFGSPEDGYDKTSIAVREEESECSNHWQHTQNQFQHQNINERPRFPWINLVASEFVPAPKTNYRHLSEAMPPPIIRRSVVERLSYCFKCNNFGHLDKDCLGFS